MVNQTYNEQLANIGHSIIEESKKNVPNIIALKAMIDYIQMLNELIRISTIDNTQEKIIAE